jgi:hypothetical protein
VAVDERLRARSRARVSTQTLGRKIETSVSIIYGILGPNLRDSQTGPNDLVRLGECAAADRNIRII